SRKIRGDTRRAVVPGARGTGEAESRSRAARAHAAGRACRQRRGYRQLAILSVGPAGRCKAELKRCASLPAPVVANIGRPKPGLQGDARSSTDGHGETGVEFLRRELRGSAAASSCPGPFAARGGAEVRGAAQAYAGGDGRAEHKRAPALSPAQGLGRDGAA